METEGSPSVVPVAEKTFGVWEFRVLGFSSLGVRG